MPIDDNKQLSFEKYRDYVFYLAKKRNAEIKAERRQALYFGN